MSWVVGDIPVEAGECYLLTECGGFLMQENYCRLVIHENDEQPPWVIGDDVEYKDPISPGGCPVPVATTDDWSAGDGPALETW